VFAIRRDQALVATTEQFSLTGVFTYSSATLGEACGVTSYGITDANDLALDGSEGISLV